jgi:hypothetical protein
MCQGELGVIIKFDVFGKQMSVIKKEHEWQLFNESDTGIRSRVYDVIIPSDINENELEKYLDDIYHEYSSEKHSKVKRLN